MMIDKITIEVIRNALLYISEEMGITLRNTAYSPNIRDRLDHTCAILSPNADLIAQAEHIPVHIGSMAVGVKNILIYMERHGIEFMEGDVIVVNDPYIAGTHLNDITLIKPVYSGREIVAIIANKAHHVDVGGSVPGSIGGDVESLYEEGIVIEPSKLIEKGEFNRRILNWLESSVRTPQYLRGDLHAQIAALNIGEKRVLELIEKYGDNIFKAALDETLGYTERYTRNRIASLGVVGRYEAVDHMELPDGNLIDIEVVVDIGRYNISIDFSGSSREVAYPINAVYGVTVAASTYSLKSIIDPNMPVNHGFYRVVDIKAEKGTIVNPEPPFPVSGGNVETSQRIADVVFKALAEAYPDRVPAASCGSMNNIMIGGVDGGWAFYETIGGGSGGRPNMDGVDGIHTNMTNTLNTPIEVVEREYPIIFIAYELRRDSCGAGKYRGGLGITRAFKVKSRATLTIMTDRVSTRPYGLAGGGEALPGYHYVVRKSGEKIILLSKATIDLDVGDIIYINTPGGGGYGDPRKRSVESIISDLKSGKLSLKYIAKNYPKQYRMIRGE